MTLKDTLQLIKTLYFLVIAEMIPWLII